MDQNNINTLKCHLRDSVTLLSNIKLYQGAKWSAEALNGMTAEESTDSDLEELPTDHIPKYTRQIILHEEDKISLAKTYFDCKEFDRCAHILKKCKSPDALFLRLYSMFISGEKKREEETEGVLGQNDQHSINSAIPLVLKELETLNNENEETSPFLDYLHGVVLARQKSTSAAREIFLKSLKKYPFNWSCWTELLTGVATLDEALQLLEGLEVEFENQFSESIMLKFAKVVMNQEFFQQSEELYAELDTLISYFPQLSFLKTQKALISYHALEYQDAEKLFDDVLVNDPLRLDDMDIYSNILYVMGKKAKLAFLAQFSCSIDKFRPETCCIVANYYSLKGEHEKAVMYYRRALTLNRHCLSAWTLMGHEFVELKNSHAAIESYRRAVDTNSKDFKAWYGLGQAYEVLDMHLYSLYYYQKASSLKPLDQRIWEALAHVYEKLERLRDAIKCYQKASSLTPSKDVAVIYKMALLYEKMGDWEIVHKYMEEIHEEGVAGVKTDETAKAQLWLAKYELARKNLTGAYAYASSLTHGSSQELEEARIIAREARNSLNRN